MIVLIESRATVGTAIAAGFEREGVPCSVIAGDTALDWLGCLSDGDRSILDGIVIGGDAMTADQVRAFRGGFDTPVVALSDRRSLDETLGLFLLGVDDVISKPVHPLEVMARLRVARRRSRNITAPTAHLDVVVYADGRDPIVGHAPMSLPRRERRILTCLSDARGGWVLKSTLFNQVYGLFNDGISESVIESHVSRLRKRLRDRLGHDAIETQRFLGYRLVQRAAPDARLSLSASYEQVLPRKAAFATGGT